MTTTYAVEFLMWLLIAASLIAVLASRLRIPYTVALVLGGLVLGSVHLPIVETLVSNKPNWLTPGVTLFIFLPTLLFEGSLKLQVRQLRESATPIVLLATIGVLAATLITGYAAHWALGLPVSIALVFGAITAATDPISVISIFKELAAPRRLSVIVEGESLFNDGTAAVLYGILVAGVASGTLGMWTGIQEFFFQSLGGVGVGLVTGYVFSMLLKRIDDPQVEITLTTVLAYGSYLIAQSLHLSGVIATVSTGLLIGNLSGAAMSPRTRLALWSFWEYASFVINSLVFLLIGLQVHVGALLRNWRAILLAIGAVVLGRILSVYGLVPISNRFSRRISLEWQHILVGGGIRGALALALALSLSSDFPYRPQILAMTFGVVAFTIVAQGLALKPLLALLGISSTPESDYERARVRQISISSAQSELESMVRNHAISQPAYEQLRHELGARFAQAKADVEELYDQDKSRIRPELQMARIRLIAAEKSAIEQAVHDSLISPQTGARMFDEADKRLDTLTGKSK